MAAKRVAPRRGGTVLAHRRVRGFDQDKAEMSSCCANYLILCDFYKLSLCLYKTTAYRASSCGNLLKQGSHL